MAKLVGLLAPVALLAVAGCALIQRSDAMDGERLLAAAGFQMKFATTPEQIAKVNTLPQRKLTRTPGPDGQNRFVYADSKFCKCVYVGTEAAYDRYQRLEVRRELAEDEEAASMNWDAWGPWGPWY
jgi:hypothetical protein